MNEDKKPAKMELTTEQAVVFADQVCGVTALVTAKKLGIHRNTVTTHRKRLNKFLKKSFDVDKFRPRLLGLVPLAIESLAYHLANKDIDVTIKFLQGTGLLAKDYEEFKELMRSVAGVAGGNSLTINLDTSSNNGNGKFGNLSNFYSTADKNSRLDPIDR